MSLLELVRLEPGHNESAIEMMHGAPVYRLRGKLLPLVYLSEALKLQESQSPEQGTNIVVLQADDRQFGLVVDEINDTEEIVVKPLGQQFKGLSCFAGATIMGDGEVALILDVLGIAQMAHVVTELRERSGIESSARKTDTAVGRNAWLVFQIAGERRMAIPLSVVSRLEEFQASAIERSGKEMVVQYRGEIMPLLDVAEYLQLARCGVSEDQETLQVVVYSDAGRSVGLVVDRILDIVDHTVGAEQNENTNGLLGSAVIQERVTDLLNVRALVRNSGSMLAEVR